MPSLGGYPHGEPHREYVLIDKFLYHPGLRQDFLGEEENGSIPLPIVLRTFRINNLDCHSYFVWPGCSRPIVYSVPCVHNRQTL